MAVAPAQAVAHPRTMSARPTVERRVYPAGVALYGGLVALGLLALSWAIVLVVVTVERDALPGLILFGVAAIPAAVGICGESARAQRIVAITKQGRERMLWVFDLRVPVSRDAAQVLVAELEAVRRSAPRCPQAIRSARASTGSPRSASLAIVSTARARAIRDPISASR